VTDDLARLDATAQAELVRSGQAAPVELVDAAVARAEKLNPELNAVIIPLYEEARRTAEGPLPGGPFRGVPYVLKDLVARSAGHPHHAGIAAAKDANWISPDETMLVERFRAAGLVCIGKSNTPELGLFPTTEPLCHGPSRNPWDTTRSTGGSSGGSAAAVASGMVPIGHANDGGGSIRIPASECGLVGLKPSRGRVPLWPDVAESWAGLVAELAVTRSVRDTAALLDAVGRPVPGDLHTPPPPPAPYADVVARPPAPLRVGVLADAPDGITATHPDCRAAVAATAAALEHLGHVVAEEAPEALRRSAMTEAFLPCYATWTAADLDLWGERVGRPLTADDVEPGTWAIAEYGRTVTGTQYMNGVNELHRISAAVQAWWAEGWDVLLTPTIPEPPPVLGSFAATPDDPMQGMWKSASIVPFTIPFNISGQPAISLPLHWNDEGLPIGIQLVAAYGREDLLLQVAAQLEQERPWADRVPPIGP
jgi:amidase